LLSVAGEDENHLAIEVLNLWQEIVQNGSAAKVVSGCKLVGFIDEEHATAVV
jgi:hypothetical protein